MSEAPSYSVEPAHDERRLRITDDGHGASNDPAGQETLSLHDDGITIVLNNQRKDARHPTYRRNASVVGEVSLSSTQGVTSISMRLGGKATINFSTAPIHIIELLDIPLTLWEVESASACPTTLPFAFVFPGNCVDKESGSSHALPPSYDPLGESISLQDLHVRCVYRLSVHIARPRWMPDKVINVDIEYAPRTAPPRAMLITPFPFRDTIRAYPEEWWRTSAILPVRPDSVLQPIDCDLFIPSVRIFARRDVIPVFLQLRGTSSSISALFSTEDKTRGLARRLLAITRGSKKPLNVDIVVQRQATALTNDGEISRSYTAGTSSLYSVPPGYTPPGMDSDTFTVDYEGEINLAPHVTVGGFNIGRLRVSDFIELSVQPSGSAANQFASLVHSVPVRIVTGWT
ncbi:unnamed protein product [Peniophora sp. CBMAI 1063]|nr:unnamed protein product [Peniophora sp. CBMAI 1063]